MASSTGTTCNLCQTKGITSAAKTWCLECCKSFCENCEERHDSSNASINHKKIPVEEYIKLLPYSKLIIYCVKHNKKYEKFCPNHQIMLCKKCIKTAHKSCRDVVSLEAVAQNAKSSGVLENIKTNIDDIQLKLQKIKQNRNDNLTSVRMQIQDIQKEISMFRSQLTKTFDKMEKELMDEMEKVENKTKSHTAILFKDLQEHEHKIQGIKRGIEGLMKYGTDFQTFLAGNQVVNIVHEEEEYMQSLFDQKKLENIIIKYKANSNFKHGVGDNLNFGHISIATAPSTIPDINMRKVRESQLPLRSHFSKLLIARKFTVKKHFNTFLLHGVCLLPNEDIIITGITREKSYNDCIAQLIVFDCDGVLKYSFPLHHTSSTNGVTAVDDRTVVVLDIPRYTISFIDIVKKESIRTFEGKYYCMGIATASDALFYTAYGNGIKKISLLNYSKSQFYHHESFGFSWVATYEDKICYTDNQNDVVVLLNSDSKIIWTYKNKKLLNSPTKVTFDKQGNIYVVGQSTSNVVFISHDGHKSWQVLSKEDGIDMHCIVFDSNRNRLIVAAFLGDVVIYNCS